MTDLVKVIKDEAAGTEPVLVAAEVPDAVYGKQPMRVKGSWSGEWHRTLIYEVDHPSKKLRVTGILNDHNEKASALEIEAMQRAVRSVLANSTNLRAVSNTVFENHEYDEEEAQISENHASLYGRKPNIKCVSCKKKGYKNQKCNHSPENCFKKIDIFEAQISQKIYSDTVKKCRNAARNGKDTHRELTALLKYKKAMRKNLKKMKF